MPSPGLVTMLTPVSISIWRHRWLRSARSWVSSIMALFASMIDLSTSSMLRPWVETKAPTRLDLFRLSFSQASLAFSI